MKQEKRIEYVIKYQYTKAENFVRWFMIVFLLLLLVVLFGYAFYAILTL